MPRSRNDPYKRKAAQALNHLSNAIVDVNEVYEAFDVQTNKLRTFAANEADPTQLANAERYAKLTESLKQPMMYIAITREALLAFIATAWELDEESIKVYLG
jgi:hypothetical protein